MSEDQAVSDAEAQAPALGKAPIPLSPIERREDKGLVVGGNTETGIADADLDLVGLDPG